MAVVGGAVSPGCHAGAVPVPLLVVFAILVIPMVMVAVAVLVTVVGLCCHPAFLVWVVVVTLCHLVSNNKMKMYFVCLQRLRPSVACFSHPWGVLRLPCVLLLLCSYPMSFTRIPVTLLLTIPHLQAAVVLGAGFLFFCQWGKGAYLAGSPGILFRHPCPKQPLHPVLTGSGGVAAETSIQSINKLGSHHMSSTHMLRHNLGASTGCSSCDVLRVG